MPTTLTKKERTAEQAFLANLKIKKRTTKKQIVVAMIGLVGSGKTSVAQELANRIGATVISNDDIRIELRKQNERYEHARIIAENACMHVIKRGGNVILDSDFVDKQKRASLREKVRDTHARLLFIRTYCDPDVVLGRIMTTVKIREMWRRTPHHYRWSNQRGGVWILKKFPFVLFAEVNTTVPDTWKQQLENSAKQLFAV